MHYSAILIAAITQGKVFRERRDVSFFSDWSVRVWERGWKVSKISSFFKHLRPTTHDLSTVEEYQRELGKEDRQSSTIPKDRGLER